MEKIYTPLEGNCIVKIANDLNKTRSGLYVKDVNTEIYEIVSLPGNLPDAYKDLKVGDKFLAWKNWKGFKVSNDLLCIDLLDIMALVE